MVIAALASLFARPKVIASAFSGFFRKKESRAGRRRAHRVAALDLVRRRAGHRRGRRLDGPRVVRRADRISARSRFRSIILLTLIAANSTALTGITPTGSLSKIPQFLFGTLNPRHPPTNLMTALMCTEVASNASNLLMDIKPGYMLGRQAAPAGDRPLHRHRRGRARQHAALLRPLPVGLPARG